MNQNPFLVTIIHVPSVKHSCQPLLASIPEGNETAQDQVVTENQATEPLATAGKI